MFTGLVEATAKLVELQTDERGAQLVLELPKDFASMAAGESLAVNGCCLTISRVAGCRLSFDLLGETLECTNLGSLATGALANIERPLPANGRFDGHFVQGHIDCTSRVHAIEKTGADHRLEVELAREFAHYAVAKGSIAINGVSLTIASVAARSFVVWIIPHTFSSTNLRELKAGDPVNLEFDILAKYVERLMQPR
jgi:riboflavin synthase